jgi:hypothetical protein
MSADRRRMVWAAAATLAVAAGLVAALLHLGSPAERRLRRLDESRVERLTSLRSNLEYALEKEGELPPDLSVLSGKPWAAPVFRDPKTHEPFTYERLTPRSFRLCATFARPSPAPPPDRETGFWAHPQGNHCFEIEVRKKEQQVSAKPGS